LRGIEKVLPVTTPVPEPPAVVNEDPWVEDTCQRHQPEADESTTAMTVEVPTRVKPVDTTSVLTPVGTTQFDADAGNRTTVNFDPETGC
jgi:hypothetical protein